MRILHVVRGLPPAIWGGAEIYTRNVAGALAARGHQVTIFAPTTAPVAQREQAHDGVTLVHAPLAPGRDATQTAQNPASQLWLTVRNRAIEAQFAALLAAEPPDVFHFQHLQGLSAQLIAQAATVSAPRIMTLHDFWFFCANSQLRRPGDETCAGPAPGCRNCVDCMTLRPELQPLRTLRPLTALPLAWRNRYLAARLAEVDQIIAPSQFLRDRYIEHGVAPDRILALEYGIAALPHGAAPLPLPAARPRFVFVGSLAPHKGVHVLVEAFNRLPAGASLTLIGGEGNIAGYAQELRSLATHPGIHFAGPQPQGVVHATLRAADCLIIPSVWYENSPLVVQEAFTAGLPVVASRIGALEEKVIEGVNGRHFAPGDVDALAAVLGELHANPAALAALRAGVRPPEDLAAHTTRLLELYARAAERHATN